MENFIQDVRYVVRGLIKTPGFTVLAVVALALGIGGTTLVFSSVYAVLLRPLPYRGLDHIVTIYQSPKGADLRSRVAIADFEDWKRQNQVFSDIAAASGWDANLTGNGEPERLDGLRVTAGYFDVLGVQPLKGRSLQPADSEGGGNRVVVVAYGFWERRLGADPNIIGKQVTLNGSAYTVVGLMPPDVGVADDVWVPLAFTPAQLADRESHYLSVIARLKSGISRRQAEAEMNMIAGRLAQQYPRHRDYEAVQLLLMRDDITFGTRQFVLTLMGASIFVLLLACANVANLQLARALKRKKEIAIRAAMGASRWRVVREVLVENIVVSFMGGALGVLLASWGLDLNRRSIPAFVLRYVPGIKYLKIDYHVLLFAFGVAFLAGILAGLVAALHASRTDLNDALKEGGRTNMGDGGRRPTRAVLVSTEVALAIVLLVGAGLMVRGFHALLASNQGYDEKNVLTLRVTLPEYKYADEDRRAAFYEQALSGLSNIPGVESAGMATSIPGAFRLPLYEFVLEGRPTTTPDERLYAGVQSIGADYLRALRIPLLAGRAFSNQDGRDNDPVAVVSAYTARRFWPNEDPIGRRIRIVRPGAVEAPWRTIVGIVGDVKQDHFDKRLRVMVYVPVAQFASGDGMFTLRTSGNPMSLATAAREQIRRVDPDQPVYDIRSLERVLGDGISGVKIAAQYMAVFAAIALVLASAGIYAVMAYAVTQRTHEIGVRLALGAGRIDVLKLIMCYVLKLTIAGLFVGCLLAVGLSRVLTSVLFGVVRMDWPTFFALVLLLGFVGAFAGYIPARWASKVDPMVALRYE
jgi:putative ABC transport system permease protein